MNVQQIFDLGIKVGMEADPRGVAGVKKYLKKIKKQYDSLSEKEKKLFEP